MQFIDILNKYRQESFSERHKGTRFEELMVRYFLTDPTYKSQLDSVVMWSDFPYRTQLGSVDTGIDLVAKTKNGEYWAIQCKFYADDHRVTKEDMDTFLSTSSRGFKDDNGEMRFFELRLIVATTDLWSSNAEEVIINQNIPVTRIGLGLLSSAPIDWSKLESDEWSEAKREVYELRKHQVFGYQKALTHYETNDRGKMIMACGTGKTFLSLRICEGLLARDVPPERDHKGIALFLAPSISLVGQSLREWMSNCKDQITPICVCSDPTVTKQKVEDEFGDRVEDLGFPATTNVSKIKEQYKNSDGITVVFSTYQSLDVIIEAQKGEDALPEFDLIVCDEAHRTTGAIFSEKDESNFTKVHKNENIKAAKRLYMTATPRIYGAKGKEDAQKASVMLCSMDDESLYGKEFYKISFGDAVELELLSDYKVLILTTMPNSIPQSIRDEWTENDKAEIETRCKVWGCFNALAKNIAFDETLKNTDPEPMRSAVSFCRSIKVSEALTEMFNRTSDEPGAPIQLEMRHIDGSMSSVKRDGLISWLKEEDDTCHILSNVRCLSEGVDVPALDAVMFMGSKGSIVDVVQSVGRVMRKAPGKKYGYIIIPIVIDEDQDPETALDDNERYKIVWDVLRALRSHDERLEAEINTFNLRTKKDGHIIIDEGGDGGNNGEPGLPSNPHSNDKKFLEFGNALMARLVLKVGDREYIENWAKKVAEITPILTEKLDKLCRDESGEYSQSFNKYLLGVRACVNNDVPPSQGIDMLVQQIVTKPIFEELFAKDGFVMKNTVSNYIDRMLKEINAKDGLSDIQDKLDSFYRTVQTTLNGIDTTEGKQKVITALYEKFFKNAFPKDQMINGVVYTPQEIVDFIIHSCVDILKQEFGKDINDEGVNVLDPFTGTGTFIARLMESGVIDKDNIVRKYQSELFANEITLLAYYIATVNIENTFQRVTGINAYFPFENILLTDTFNIEEICKAFGTETQTTLDQSEYFAYNRRRIRREHNSPITIIMGNPPYGANQKSANDNAKKRKYRSGIDARIESTYLDESLFTNKVNLVNSVYDNYIRAFRWASDRIGDNDGIISFVTPSGWLTASAFEGFRKTLQKEYSSIYVFNLRGDKGTTDEMRRIEGRNVFEYSSDRGGCTVSVSITLLVKKKNKTGQAEIKYVDMASFGDRLKGYEKRNIIKESISFPNLISSEKMSILNPSDNGDWIIQRNNAFQTLIPIAGDTHKKFEQHHESTLFVGYSNGNKTQRDVWSYNYSRESLKNNIQNLINEYNRQTESNVIEYDSTKIKWSRSLENLSGRHTKIRYNDSKTVKSNYRPFSLYWSYVDSTLVDMPGQMPRIYPEGVDNLTICTASIGDKKDFSCLITNTHTDLHFTGTSQCFPLYWYKSHESPKDGQTTLTDESNERIKHDGISDYALNTAREKYGNDVTKEDIFYYIYGYLHSPDYRAAFPEDLKLSLPRIGFVDSYDDFKAFSEAGRKLAELHLNYEIAPYCKEVTINGSKDLESFLSDESRLKVTKMKLDEKQRKLFYNGNITVENIPEAAFKYIVNGRSALGWLVDQYQYSVDKESGIVNDPNEYDGPSYILSLILSVITVGVETMKIVESLPKLDFSNKEEQNKD